jgi:cytochrome b561
MKQYSKRMVITHWLTLLVLIVAWYFGHELDEARHEAGATLIGYIAHSLIGGVVLVLTILRLYFRSKDGTPSALGNTLMDNAAKGAHYLLYGLLLLLPVSGMMTVFTSDVSKALQAGDATLLPKKFTGVPAHEVHEILVKVLVVIVVLHILGAVWHQFIKKDGLMDRMSFHRKD